ncbi:hypothetical protein HMPREF0201_01637 [Cedecea davisae DSM 4568]|uniref:Uncharacterized protein n=1 Tax=Cedecea davisae DSM 4568 TaxID=566551 RepID=S3J0F4_9ENTR|nr:hypothetical protein HMPREF0201_01637 [Cedecea davisae DSM 4568]
MISVVIACPLHKHFVQYLIFYLFRMIKAAGLKIQLVAFSFHCLRFF